MVVAGPGVETLGLVDRRCQVADITPTLLDFAGVDYAPDEFYGRSLRPLLQGQVDAVYAETDSFAFEVSGTAALYRGNWKITKTPAPYGDAQWHLYDLSSDPGETTDLAALHPDLFADLQREYRSYAQDVGVYELPPGESARDLIVANGIKAFAVNYWYLLVGIFMVVMTVVFGTFRAFKILLRRRSAPAKES